MSPWLRRVLFALFFLSGFSSLVCELVWTRLAFASFGIITPVLSVVISMFMLGLAAGSWSAGRWMNRRRIGRRVPAIAFYAGVECVIGLGALTVPSLLHLGASALLGIGEMNSFSYLAASGFMISIAILPACFCMGATFPLMMAFVREQHPSSAHSFSFLYLANVLGALSGTLLSAVVFIELLGLRHTLWVAATANFTVAAISAGLTFGFRHSATPNENLPPSAAPLTLRSELGRGVILTALFLTGFTAMGMEVVWIRAFMPVLGTEVYAFAMVLFAYLVATAIGSGWYRFDVRRGRRRKIAALVALTSLCALLPVCVSDFRLLSTIHSVAFGLTRSIVLLLSISPFCALLGYITPRLLDEYSAGEPRPAGAAYALNITGCILGPLFAAYVLLPLVSEKNALIVFAVPVLGLLIWSVPILSRVGRIASITCALGLVIWSIFFAWDFADYLSRRSPRVEVRHDFVATVASMGIDRHKQLLVNGQGMTVLIPATKYMVHIPVLLHNGPVRSCLIICFGMGTSFRSAVSWNTDTTAVELVPSVPKAFGFYHADADVVRANPNARIVIDDGRRFLARTRQKFDVIVIDPPPPLEAAGSSLLYSREFYEMIKSRLAPHGIVQGWLSEGRTDTEQAIYRSFRESFPFVECFLALNYNGVHMLGSLEPINVGATDELIKAMPPRAQDDLLEWSESRDLVTDLDTVLGRTVIESTLLNPDASVRITDDRPYNEYFLLRQFFPSRR